MKKTNLKEKLSLVLCTVLIVAMALFTTGCSKEGDNSQSQPNSNSQVESQSEQQKENLTAKTYEDGEVIGEGEKSFIFIVKDHDGEKRFTVNTDETIVGKALLATGIIAGEDGEYGLYVKTVNGVTADYDKDGEYWAFYVDGEYAQTGVDQTELQEGSEYSFKIEK